MTNCMREVEECKVMKCGFTLVYEPEKVENMELCEGEGILKLE